MGWFEEQIRQRMAKDEEMFADAFAQMVNLVSNQKIAAGFNDDRKIAEEHIHTISW